jgi:dihydrodipicolinate synthase/N-acetylneuraminate lyase
MSYTWDELKGVCGMMPAFATDNAGDLLATDTINVQNLQEGVDKIIKDGIGLICTTGSFGQCYNLFFDEFKTIVRAAIEANNKRVPLMLGVTSSNPREVAQKMKFVREAGGEGVLLGLPYYDGMSVPKIVDFYKQICALFPDLSVMIYHNPPNHKAHIPVRAFPELIKNPNIVCMKDSHRSVTEFIALHEVIDGHIAHMVNQMQMYPYISMGAAGCWSINAWQGPWPIIRFYQACVEGDTETAKRIQKELRGDGGSDDRQAAMLPDVQGGDVQAYAGYIKPGPYRAPHALGPQDPTHERAKKAAEKWNQLCEKYRPEVEARRKSAVLV